MSVNPRKENQKRLKIVKSFFKHIEAPQLLRRTSLTFQLTGGVEALVSQKPAPGEMPPLVKLCKHAATELVDDRVHRLLRSMGAGDDPALDVAAAVTTLLAVAMELEIRNRQFHNYPAKLCRMCVMWFLHGDLRAARSFLSEAVEQLDVGVGLPSQEFAWKQGSETAAAAWMLSGPVKGVLNKLATIMLSNSLEAERRAAQTKKWEGSDLTHIATASRSAISARHLR